MAPRPREGLRGGKKAALGQPAHRGGKTLSPWYKRPAQASPAFHHRQPGREEARSFVRGHPHPLLQLGPQPSLPRLPPCNHSFLFGVETRPSRWGEGSRHPSGQGLLWREGGAGSQGYPASWNFGSLGAKAGPPFPARRPVNKYLPDAGLRFPGCGGTLVGTARQARWSKISPTPPPPQGCGARSKGLGPQDSSWHPALPPQTQNHRLPSSRAGAQSHSASVPPRCGGGRLGSQATGPPPAAHTLGPSRLLPVSLPLSPPPKEGTQSPSLGSKAHSSGSPSLPPSLPHSLKPFNSGPGEKLALGFSKEQNSHTGVQSLSGKHSGCVSSTKSLRPQGTLGARGPRLRDGATGIQIGALH